MICEGLQGVDVEQLQYYILLKMVYLEVDMRCLEQGMGYYVLKKRKSWQ